MNSFMGCRRRSRTHKDSGQNNNSVTRGSCVIVWLSVLTYAGAFVAVRAVRVRERMHTLDLPRTLWWVQGKRSLESSSTSSQ